MNCLATVFEPRDSNNLDEVHNHKCSYLWQKSALQCNEVIQHSNLTKIDFVLHTLANMHPENQ